MTHNNGYRVNLPVFEGPLDLLLSLIEREELDITKVSLAQVTDQYLAYLEQMGQVRPEVLADFLVIAAKLILIKSQALLPRPPAIAPEGDLEVGDDLVEQLRMYKQFKVAAAQLRQRQEQGLRTFIRLAPPPKIDTRLDLSDVTISDLLAAVREALEVEEPAPTVDEIVSRRNITIKGQMNMIRQQLRTRPQVLFQELLSTAVSRVEIAITLLATLELIKQREVTAYQEKLFGKIIIQKKPAALDKDA